VIHGHEDPRHRPALVLDRVLREARRRADSVYSNLRVGVRSTGTGEDLVNLPEEISLGDALRLGNPAPKRDVSAVISCFGLSDER
jgi:hypothetical protein